MQTSDINLFQDENEELRFFIKHLRGAEMHWFFIQAVKAMQSELYIPACSSFLNGIEASLRITIAQLDIAAEVKELSPYKVLSNVLISKAKDLSIPVELLAFSDENDFIQKLTSVKPNRVDVEIVRVRNNICHGNLLEFVNTELGEGMNFLTPECLRDTSNDLYEISKKWVVGLGKFRHDNIGV